jgi:hypothetical protein
MNGGAEASAVADDELLARFVLSSSHFRSKDQTIKPDAFMPHKVRLDLSLTRHLGLTALEIWEIGAGIANSRQPSCTLYGRGDIIARSFTDVALRIEPTPAPKNHVNIIGWPADKAAQKSLAQQLAALAKYVPKPDA